MVTHVGKYIEEVNSVLPGAQIIKCKGFIKNHDYQKAKSPLGSYIGKYSLTESEINQHIACGGWIGAVIPKNHIIIDVDNQEVAAHLVKLLQGEKLRFHLIKTPNGMQFIFKSTSQENHKIKMISKWFTSIGVVIDTRVGTSNGLIVFPTYNTKNRFVVEVVPELSELPAYLRPIFNTSKIRDFTFPIPMMVGSRNQTLFELGSKVKTLGKANNDLIEESLKLVYKYFMLNKNEFDEKELQNTIESIKGFELKIQSNCKLISTSREKKEHFVIPKPFLIENNRLFREDMKKVDGERVEITTLVSRYAPLISKIFEHIDRGEIYYEITWSNDSRTYTETVSAGTIASKRELIKLADRGLSVNDLNSKNLVEYFDSFLGQNMVERFKMVDRLGMVKGEFIHPLITEEIQIIPTDFGYKRIVNAFQTSGTVDDWKESVLDKIKHNPKALFMILSSFTSVILEDLNLEPIIVDLTGTTSRGKSRVLAAASSVWGNESLISEFNSTLNSIERKAAFLGNYPVLIDDHNKAPRFVLEKLIYNFSGGQSKGRATVKGIQEEFTWHNILLCNGENSILDYVEKAGGASARVISLSDFNFDEEKDGFFIKLSEGIEFNHGAVGIDFIKSWKEKKGLFAPQYNKYRELFNKLSKNNHVITRLSRHYAAVVFTADTLNKLFNFEIDCNSLIHLFNEMVNANKSLDKPRQLLEEILQELDSDRSSIFYEFHSAHERKAVFREGQLYLLPKFLKNSLGVEMKQIRNEWIKKGFTYELTSKNLAPDSKLIKHKGETMQVIPVNPSIVEELGFDFKSDWIDSKK